MTEAAEATAKPVKLTKEELAAEKRERAARQAAKVNKPLEPISYVECRVMKAGDGKISTGEHVAGVGEVHYDRGETFTCVSTTAASYEDRGWVEIL